MKKMLYYVYVHIWYCGYVCETAYILRIGEPYGMEKDKFWEYFDDESRAYVETIMDAEADYYEKAEKFITPFMIPGGSVLYIGNGGILNYDYSQLKELLCADISISKKIEEVYKSVPNVSFIESNIMDMDNVADERFDAVIVQKVIHHLAEDNYKKTKENCVKAMRECIRVLKPGGCLIVCESTVKRWFECLEIAFFKPMLACCDLIKFDRVFQYSRASLQKLLKDKLSDVAHIEQVENIGGGGIRTFPRKEIPVALSSM